MPVLRETVDMKSLERSAASAFAKPSGFGQIAQQRSHSVHQRVYIRVNKAVFAVAYDRGEVGCGETDGRHADRHRFHDASPRLVQRIGLKKTVTRAECRQIELANLAEAAQPFGVHAHEIKRNPRARPGGNVWPEPSAALGKMIYHHNAAFKLATVTDAVGHHDAVSVNAWA